MNRTYLLDFATFQAELGLTGAIARTWYELSKTGDEQGFKNRQFAKAQLRYEIEQTVKSDQQDITPADYAAAYAMGEGSDHVDDEIKHIVEEIRQTVDNMATLEETVVNRKLRLRTLLIQRGENWKDDDGYARLMSDSVRASYNTKMLDALIVSDPEAYGWLKDFRGEFTVRGGVQVK